MCMLHFEANDSELMQVLRYKIMLTVVYFSHLQKKRLLKTNKTC